MAISGILFHQEDTSYNIQHKKALSEWITKAILNEQQAHSGISFIICSDLYLLELNKKFLDHDYFTDVITFPSSENDTIAGDVFISIDRVMENAAAHSSNPEDELHRVMIHGVLHLLGYDDKDPDRKAEMTEKEDYYLSLREFSAA